MRRTHPLPRQVSTVRSREKFKVILRRVGVYGIDLLFLLAVYQAVIVGQSEGLKNIVVFLVMFVAVVGLLLFLLSSAIPSYKIGRVRHIAQRRRVKGNGYLPLWLDITLDVTNLLMFVYGGWWVTACAWLVHILLYHISRKQVEGYEGGVSEITIDEQGTVKKSSTSNKLSQ